MISQRPNLNCQTHIFPRYRVKSKIRPRNLSCGSKLSSNDDDVRHIENIDINNGYLQLTTDDTPRQIVAQISIQATKNAIDQTTNPLTPLKHTR